MYFFIISDKTLTANKEKIRLFFLKKIKKIIKAFHCLWEGLRALGQKGAFSLCFFFCASWKITFAVTLGEKWKFVKAVSKSKMFVPIFKHHILVCHKTKANQWLLRNPETVGLFRSTPELKLASWLLIFYSNLQNS